MRIRALLPPGLVIIATALWLLSWVFTNPPGASPDEPVNYVKAVAAGGGQLLGTRENYPPPAGAAAQAQWLTRVEKLYGEPLSVPVAKWTSYIGRNYTIPGDLVPDARIGCDRFLPNNTASCLNNSVPSPPAGSVSTPSYVGGYSPFLYILPGVVARFAHDPITAVRLARLVSAILVLILLSGAVILMGLDAGMVALGGVAAAMTPMVFFMGSSMNANGPEIAAAICFAAGVMRLSRSDTPKRWMWLVTGLAGLILLIARPLGPFWVAAILLVPLIRLGVRGSIQRLRSGGRWTVAALGCLGAGGAAALVWQLVQGSFPLARPSHVVSLAIGSFNNIGGQIYQQIAVFGWLDTGMPGIFYMIWIALVTTLVGIALFLGSTRERLIVIGAILSSVLVGVLNDVLLANPTGFSGQGRHWLPLAVLVPIAAGDVIASNMPRLRGRRPQLTAWILPFAATLQVVAWYQNARRYAVGEKGPVWFLPHAQWAPPAGWQFWFVVMGLGWIAMLAAGLLTSRRGGDYGNPIDHSCGEPNEVPPATSTQAEPELMATRSA